MKKSLTFVTTFRVLKVVITAPRTLTDPMSGNIGQRIPGQYAQFKDLRYTTSDPFEQRVLVEKYYTAKERGYNVTFAPMTKEDKETADLIWKQISREGQSTERVVESKDEQIALLTAEIERQRTILQHYDPAAADRLAKKNRSKLLLKAAGEEEISTDDLDAGDLDVSEETTASVEPTDGQK